MHVIWLAKTWEEDFCFDCCGGAVFSLDFV
jgi:hypothetical protein